MTANEYAPGKTVSFSGGYEEPNAPGVRTGRIIMVEEGDDFPGTPRGYSWRPLSERSVAELRAKAAEYRQMAATARTMHAMEGLRKLADRFDALADKREQEGRSD
jgi:hypothetical protein